ncbi:MAG TPA: PKD domain-containing protein [Thermoplasmata archaeon]
MATVRATAIAATTLTVNGSYFDEGGQWNCGQGRETFAFFSAASGGSGPYRYSWNYGDGTPNASSSDPVHTYLSLGPFVAVLTVHDTSNGTGQSVLTVQWGIPLDCVDPSPINWAGVVLYVLFIVAAVAFIAAVWRWRRRPPR